MTCPDPAMLDQYLSGDLGADAERAIDEHLTGCAPCRDMVADIEASLAEARFVGRSARRLSAPAEPVRGQRLGPYLLTRELGRGGMGVVFDATDTRLDRPVAIKLLSGALSTSRYRRRRFHLEAKLLAALDHPNIVTIYSLEEIDGHVAITMARVPGETLEQRLERGPLAVTHALHVTLDVARALECAHARGIVHQDLKPANVMLTGGRGARVLDFGLARAFGPADSRPASSPAGTPGYMSPELISGDSAGPDADLFALGATLVECLTGAPAFGGATPQARLEATHARRRPIERLPPDTPAGVRELLAALLAPPSARRPLTASEVVEALEDALDDRPDALDTGASDAADALPHYTSSFVGRHAEILDVHRRLRRHRLVTLVGTGGCGKTRLAVESARRAAGRFAGGIRLVELADVRGEEEVLRRLAGVLGVRAGGSDAQREAVAGKLSREAMLIVLDGAEHALDGSARVAEDLLRSGGPSRFLATTRERIGIAGEILIHVPPLELGTVSEGDDERMDVAGAHRVLAAASASDAVQLFVERAQAVDPSFRTTPATLPHVVNVCRRLDGLPLAIELAAAGVRALGVEELAARLDRHLGDIRGGRSRVPHHRTIEACIDWSYARLDAPEQRLFQTIGVFDGGATLDAAERVAGDAGAGAVLSRLVDRSLVVVDHGTGAPRYLLLETLRHHARARLAESGREDGVRARHRDVFLELAESAATELTGPRQAEWLERLEREDANLGVAIETCLAEGDAALACRLAAAMGRYWMVRGHWTRGRGTCRRIRALAEQSSPSGALAMVLVWEGSLAGAQGDAADAIGALDRALEISRALGDRHAEARALNARGGVAYVRGRWSEARVLFSEALEIRRAAGDDWGVAACLHNLGTVASERRAHAEAEQLLGEGLAIRRRLGDRRGVAMAINNLGRLHEQRGDLERARALHEEGLELHREIGDRQGVGMSLTALGRIATALDDAPAAQRFFEEGLHIRRRLGDRHDEANSLEALARLARRSGRQEEARELYIQVLAIRTALRNDGAVAKLLETLADVEAEDGAAERATALRGAAEGLAGGSLAMEQVIELALGDRDTSHPY